MIRLFRRLACFFGFHHYDLTPIIANLNTYWLQGGRECSRCHAKNVAFTDAAMLIQQAYRRGKDDATTEFVAYGRGGSKIISMYSMPYVQKILDSNKP